MTRKIVPSAMVAVLALAGCGDAGSNGVGPRDASTSADGQPPPSSGDLGGSGGRGRSDLPGGAGIEASAASGGAGGSPAAKGAGGIAVLGGATGSGGRPATGVSGMSGGAGSTRRADGGPARGGDNARADAAVEGHSGNSGKGGQDGGTRPAGSGGSGADAKTTGSSGTTGPCDIYESGNTPCVAAHSTVRSLYGSYSGNLYQVRRASDKTTKEIPVLSAGGYADSAVQDAFCASTTCTISMIYDQSPKGNHLAKSPAGGWLKSGGLEANASAAKVKLNGHAVYGVYTTGSFDESVGGVGYRNNNTTGVATGDDPEAMYMVVSGKHYNQWCCFDYGNAETNNLDNGKATMEAVYFGNSTQWGKGSGTGPWVMADLEDGVYAGGSLDAPATNTSIVADYVTAMLKGPSGNRFVLKGSDAQSGTLKTLYDGARPTGYSPQKKEGAIILGTGGDNSHTGEGTFFEGCMTSGLPSDDTDNAVQANIVAAGYGR